MQKERQAGKERKKVSADLKGESAKKARMRRRGKVQGNSRTKTEGGGLSR